VARHSARGFVVFCLSVQKFCDCFSGLSRPTAHSWLIDLRVFFSDLCAWATELDSPFKRFAPRTIPATRHTFLGYGFEKARERTRARITATVPDLEREMPKIRAFALQQWKASVTAPKVATTRGYPWSDEVDTFWDWALLELLVQSGLRIEEASELIIHSAGVRRFGEAQQLIGFCGRHLSERLAFLLTGEAPPHH
jgi:hypothetical protein